MSEVELSFWSQAPLCPAAQGRHGGESSRGDGRPQPFGGAKLRFLFSPQPNFFSPQLNFPLSSCAESKDLLSLRASTRFQGVLPVTLLFFIRTKARRLHRENSLTGSSRYPHSRGPSFALGRYALSRGSEDDRCNSSLRMGDAASRVSTLHAGPSIHSVAAECGPASRGQSAGLRRCP